MGGRENKTGLFGPFGGAVRKPQGETKRWWEKPRAEGGRGNFVRSGRDGNARQVKKNQKETSIYERRTRRGDAVPERRGI